MSRGSRLPLASFKTLYTDLGVKSWLVNVRDGLPSEHSSVLDTIAPALSVTRREERLAQVVR